MQLHDPPLVLTSPPPAAVEASDDGTEGRLLERTATGDRAAFAAVYDQFAPLVFGIALRVVRDPAMAQEVTQDVFLTVWCTAAKFDRTRGSARAWVATIAHRRAVDVVRSEQASRNRVERAAPTMFHRAFDEVAETVVGRSGDDEVKVALRSLTDLQRRAVELAYYQGLTHREVAEVLGVPLGTAKTRIRDGLRRLAAELRAAPVGSRVPA